MTTGEPLVMRVAMKPIPSLKAGMPTVDFASGETVFRKHTGLSPQKYFSRIRLSYLRQELLTCDNSITELALKYNFHHLGDFSASYRALYGELPSDTRKNAVDADRQNSLEQLNWRRA